MVLGATRTSCSLYNKLMKRLEELEADLVQRAQPHYTDELPYHNWGHAEDVINNAAVLHEQSNEIGKRANKSLLMIAAAWHDADYHLPVDADGGTREERSAELATDQLDELSERDREVVAKAIIDTTAGKPSLETVTGVLLHFADIGYFAYEDHSEFRRRLRDWQNENEYSDEETLQLTKRFGSAVVTQAFNILPAVLDDRQVLDWVGRVRKNIYLLEED